MRKGDTKLLLQLSYHADPAEGWGEVHLKLRTTFLVCWVVLEHIAPGDLIHQAYRKGVWQGGEGVALWTGVNSPSPLT